MTQPNTSWMRTAIAFGLGYAAVGILFALPSEHVKVWRFAAWGVSMIAYASHIYLERFQRRNSPLITALHVACAVALGAFGLALGALFHSVWRVQAPTHHRLLGLALVAWPIVTALPGFVVAFAVSGLPWRTTGDQR